jgi:pimeloyl-ACP methyl ester carboxylesterase
LVPVVSAGEIELSYERTGSGPPLLLIMGLSGSALTWGEPFLERLRRDFETIVYDHRGVGQSSRMEEPFTIAQLAVDATGLLDALEIGSADVLGVSMGGMVAQELALSHPERVSTLTLGCTYCGGDGSSRASPEVARRLAEGSRSGDRERAVRAYWEANVSVGFAEDANAYAAYRANALNRRVALPVIAAQLQAIAVHETLTRLHQLMMPTLIVHGTADQIIPVGNAHLIAAQIPGSRLEIFDGVGHLFFLERPERSAVLVREHATIPA